MQITFCNLKGPRIKSYEKFYSAGKMHKKAHQQLPGALKILTRCAPSKEAMNDDSWFYPWQIPTPLGPRFLQKRKSSLNNIHSQIYFLTENKSMISPTPQPSWSKKKTKTHGNSVPAGSTPCGTATSAASQALHCDCRRPQTSRARSSCLPGDASAVPKM